MALRSRLTIAKKDIFALFDRSPKKVHSERELSAVLEQNRAFWRLAVRTTVRDFIRFLEDQGKLKSHIFHATNYNRTTSRYSWGDASPYELAQSLRLRGYLSHATAVSLHGLTDLIPRTIYLNVEQTPKPSPSGSLAQEAIDRAFSGRQRQSNLTYEYQDWSVTIVSGKNTSDLGVEELIGPSGERLRVTNLERTLIDIVVRPTYAGGIFQVLQSYRAAKDRVSTNRLVATLKKLGYVYPYHQAIGFLMEATGYDAKRTDLLRQLGLKHDFYLAHGMNQPEYSNNWRLFYPKGVQQLVA